MTKHSIEKMTITYTTSITYMFSYKRWLVVRNFSNSQNSKFSKYKRMKNGIKINRYSKFFGMFAMSMVISASVSAQVTSGDSLSVRPFQITFISPMGTNGIDCGKIDNMLSVNIFSGYSGALHGIELGAFSNIVKNDAQGIQVSGFSNIVGGAFDGIQVAGFSNLVRQSFKGVQCSGFSNLTASNFEGIQVSGFANTVRGNFNYVQTSGFSNVIGGNLNGIQCSGFSNIVGGELFGGQFAAFSNIARGSSKAIQISGFLNSASDSLEGIQASGFLNVAKSVRGAQFGVVNYCDTISRGIPVGFISIVKHGKHEIELGAGETFHTELSFRTGVSRFYNIFSAGVKFDNSGIYYGGGYGAGTEFDFGSKLCMNVDLVGYFFTQQNSTWSMSEVDNLTKLQITVSKPIYKSLKIYLGPTLNLATSARKNAEGTFTGSPAAIGVFYSAENQWYKTELYPGFRIGLRL